LANRFLLGLFPAPFHEGRSVVESGRFMPKLSE
jgi:hypothetical protein